MPKWKELKRFCERDNWELYKSKNIIGFDCYTAGVVH